MPFATPSKINLGLHVLRKRADGYHDLETVFLPIGWSDQITIEAAPDFSMTCSHPDLPVDEGNLCLKAARLLAQHTGYTGGVRIHLEKNLPVGAGLGGGSANAARILVELTRLWNVQPAPEDLQNMAAQLGSDVAFFLHQTPAFAEGRGEVLHPLMDQNGQPYRFPFSLCVVMPPLHVSTAAAYRAIRPHDVNRPDLRALVASNNLAAWRAALVNDFEAPIFDQFPLIATVKTALYDAGAAYAAMSGSGAAVFGVFAHPNDAAQAALQFRQNNWPVWWG